MVNRNILIVLDRAHPNYDADVQKLRQYSQAHRGNCFVAMGCAIQFSFVGYDEEEKYIRLCAEYMKEYAKNNIDSLVEFHDLGEESK